jgi:anaerobic selenocysteine-containing dehydrogenase
MAAYGSPNFVEMPSLEISRAVAEKAQFGHTNQIGYDLGKASFVLSFGCALIEGWGSPVRSIQAYSSWKTKGGVKLVQVDTRASLTASKADDFVAAAPGTEGALALALAHVIIRDGLFKKDWVEAHAFGFEEFKNLVIREYAPKAVSELTGVPAEKIEALAKEFAKAKAPLALGGRGAGAAPTPVYELMAVMALNALVGNINQPGGVIVRRSLPLTPLAEAPVDDKAKTTLAMPRLDGALSAKYPLTPSILENLTDAILGGGPYPVNVVILDQANPAFFGANPSAFVAALAKAPLVVTFNSLADDSGMLADLALPETSNFDGPVEVTTPPSVPFPVFGAAGALTDTGFDAKPIGDILAGLAKAVGGSAAQALPFKNHAEMVQKAAEGLFSSGRGRVAKGNLAADVFGQKDEPQKFKDVKEFQKALAAGRFWYDPGFTFGVLENTFLTPSTKFEFFSQTLQAALAGFVGEKGPEAAMVELGLKAKADQLCLPHYEPIAPKPSDALPLLMMPVEQLKMVTNARGNAPYLTKLLEDITLAGNELVVEIHPETAEKAHLYEGDLARLDTLKGAAHVRVHLFEGARPGVIYAPLGLGHRGFGYYLRGKGMNPMEFVDRTPDPLSGQALWWGTKANLTKV